MQILVLVPTGGNIALQGRVIGFTPVLKTLQIQRATSPTARFFHVQNSKFWMWGLPIRKDGSMAVSMF